MSKHNLSAATVIILSLLYVAMQLKIHCKQDTNKKVKHDRSYLHTLILAHDTGQLKITFDLLPDLLKAVHDGYRGDGMNATQNV